MSLVTTLLIECVVAAASAVAQSAQTDEPISFLRLMPNGHWIRVEVGAGHATQPDGASLPDASDGTMLVRLPIGPASWRSSAVLLATGERLTGTPILRESGLHWRHSVLGAVPLVDGTIAAIVLRDGAATPEATASDIVVLANGDRVEGLVVAIDDPLVIEHPGASASTLPLDRIAAISLVHEAVSPGPVRIWLSDGTALDASEAIEAPGGLMLRGLSLFPSGGAGRMFGPPAIAAVRWGAAPLALASLKPVSHPSSQTCSALPGSEPMEVAPGVWPLGLASVQLRGDTRYEFPPCARLMRLSTLAKIPIGLRAYADFDVVVRGTAGELGRWHFDSIHPELPIVVDLPPGQWSIELVDHGNGPVGDVLDLDLGALLDVAPARAGPAAAVPAAP